MYSAAPSPIRMTCARMPLRSASPLVISLISRAANAQTAARPPVIGRSWPGHDVGVEEDEAAEEHLEQDQVAQRDVDDPPQVGAQPKRELARRPDHVRAREVERDREDPEDHERRGDRPLDERLSGVEEAGTWSGVTVHLLVSGLGRTDGGPPGRAPARRARPGCPRGHARRRRSRMGSRRRRRSGSSGTPRRAPPARRSPAGWPRSARSRRPGSGGVDTRPVGDVEAQRGLGRRPVADGRQDLGLAVARRRRGTRGWSPRRGGRRPRPR